MVNNMTLALIPFLSQLEEKLHIADIANTLDIGHTTVRLWLNELERKGILIKSNKGRLTLYELHKEHPHIVDYLTLAEKMHLLQKTHHPVLQDLVGFLHKQNTLCLIFGSSVTNYSRANDIDILTIGERRIRFPTHMKNIHHIHVQRIRNISESLRREIIKKHLLVNGSEQFIKWMLWGQSSGAINNQKVSNS